MANEFIIKNGFHSKGDSQVTGSLGVSGSLQIQGIADVSASLAAKAEGTILYEEGSGTDSIKPIANSNTAVGSCAVVGGGRGNKATGNNSTVSGGYCNCACSNDSTIGGGCT